MEELGDPMSVPDRSPAVISDALHRLEPVPIVGGADLEPENKYEGVCDLLESFTYSQEVFTSDCSFFRRPVGHQRGNGPGTSSRGSIDYS